MKLSLKDDKQLLSGGGSAKGIVLDAESWWGESHGKQKQCEDLDAVLECLKAGIAPVIKRKKENEPYAKLYPSVMVSADYNDNDVRISFYYVDPTGSEENRFPCFVATYWGDFVGDDHTFGSLQDVIDAVSN